MNETPTVEFRELQTDERGQVPRELFDIQGGGPLLPLSQGLFLSLCRLDSDCWD